MELQVVMDKSLIHTGLKINWKLLTLETAVDKFQIKGIKTSFQSQRIPL